MRNRLKLRAKRTGGASSIRSRRACAPRRIARRRSCGTAALRAPSNCASGRKPVGSVGWIIIVSGGSNGASLSPSGGYRKCPTPCPCWTCSRPKRSRSIGRIGCTALRARGAGEIDAAAAPLRELRWCCRATARPRPRAGGHDEVTAFHGIVEHAGHAAVIGGPGQPSAGPAGCRAARRRAVPAPRPATVATWSRYRSTPVRKPACRARR